MIEQLAHVGNPVGRCGDCVYTRVLADYNTTFLSTESYLSNAKRVPSSALRTHVRTHLPNFESSCSATFTSLILFFFQPLSGFSVSRYIYFHDFRGSTEFLYSQEQILLLDSVMFVYPYALKLGILEEI